MAEQVKTTSAAATNNYPITPIISPQFCVPRNVNLIISRKFSLCGGDYVVKDDYGNIMFNADNPSLFSFHSKRVIFDAADRPIVTLREKKLTMHHRWKVFRGQSSEPQDLLFSAKLSSLVPFNRELDVFLANNNTEEKICDFKVKGSWLERSCVIYAGESSTIVAQMQKKFTAKGIFLAMDDFMVKVQPNMDHAFIVAVILILDEIARSRRRNNSSHNANH